jgi:hypothetical protein
MTIVDFASLPDDARVWVFGASDVLSPESELVLLRSVDEFLAEWRAHGIPLRCAREWREGRFLCIAVDQQSAAASGCSIDGLFRTLRSLEPQLGTSLTNAALVFWRDEHGLVQRCARPEFAALSASGVIQPTTRVFDLTVNTRAAWLHDFERVARDSWHAKYLAVDIRP